MLPELRTLLASLHTMPYLRIDTLCIPRTYWLDIHLWLELASDGARQVDLFVCSQCASHLPRGYSNTCPRRYNASTGATSTPPTMSPSFTTPATRWPRSTTRTRTRLEMTWMVRMVWTTHYWDSWGSNRTLGGRTTADHCPREHCPRHQHPCLSNHRPPRHRH